MSFSLPNIMQEQLQKLRELIRLSEVAIGFIERGETREADQLRRECVAPRFQDADIILGNFAIFQMPPRNIFHNTIYESNNGED